MEQDCTRVVVPNVDDLKACFGWDGDAWPPAPECCVCDVVFPVTDTEFHLNYCQADFSVEIACDPRVWVEQECEDGQYFLVAPNAEYVLYISNVYSYVSVSSPGGSEVFPLAGGGSIHTGPDRLLTVTAWAGDGTLGSKDFEGWMWWAESPIDIDIQSGSFTVPAEENPEFHGSGYEDSEPQIATVFMGEDGNGSLNNVTDTWEFDFSQAGFGWNVVVHLEGPYEEVP